jgi:hypothetical protein
MDNQITLNEASLLTSKYRNNHAGGDYIKGECFTASDLQQVLSQSGCESIRIYYGADETGKGSLVITGVDENGNNLFQGILLGNAHRCPAECSSANPLNS